MAKISFQDIQTPVDEYVAQHLSVADKVYVIYSAHGSADDNDMIDNNLQDVPLEGKFKIWQEHDEFWGSGENYESEIVESLTWIELCVLANEMIAITGDKHHVFLEDVMIKDLNHEIPIVEFCMGS